MTDQTAPLPVPGPMPGAGHLPAPQPVSLHAELSRVWPDNGRRLPAASTVLAAVAGLVAAVLLPDSQPGLGLVLVGLLVAAAALPAARGRFGAHEVGFGVLAALLLTTVAVRDAPWLVALCLLGVTGLAPYALAPARTVLGVVLGGLSLPLAVLRGGAWAARGVSAHLGPVSRSWWRNAWAAVATVAVVLVFGALFASADPVFASLVPELHLDLVPGRAVVFLAVFAVALAITFLTAVPPRWDALAPADAPRPVRTGEWAVPIAALDLLFAGFIAVQVTVFFGGNAHVLDTAGLTYAEYARTGFGQLMAVTVLTLTVVAAAARWAPRRTPRQRLLLQLLLGLLGALTLLVVASALHRLHVYEQAFGLTRLRLFMYAFESWLGVLVGLVLLAGVRLRGTWLPRAAVATGALTLLALTAMNPDAFVAERNIERFEATGQLDTYYLSGLSADAVPAIARLPEPVRSTVLDGMGEPTDAGPAGWNLGRWRAQQVLDDLAPR